jgi:hypothetical protein
MSASVTSIPPTTTAIRSSTRSAPESKSCRTSARGSAGSDRRSTIASPASINAGKTYRQQYQITKYDIGLALASAHSPLYLYGGFAADQYTAKQNAPIGQQHDGPYLGLGVKL